MEIKEGQFTTLPDDITKTPDISVDDVVVYLMIKKHMNGTSRCAFRSLRDLKDECELSVPSIQKCINNLADKGYIQKISQGQRKATKYKFPVEKEGDFEMIALNFLTNPDLSAREKGLLAILQKHFKIDAAAGMGRVFLSRPEILTETNLSQSMLTRIEKGLSQKEIYKTLTSCAKDEITRIRKDQRITDIEKTKQAETLLAENVDAMKMFMGQMFKEFLFQFEQMNNRLDKLEKSTSGIPKKYPFEIVLPDEKEN